MKKSVFLALELKKELHFVTATFQPFLTFVSKFYSQFGCRHSLGLTIFHFENIKCLRCPATCKYVRRHVNNYFLSQPMAASHNVVEGDWT